MKIIDAAFVLKTPSGERVEAPVVIDIDTAAKQVEGAEIALESARAAFQKNRYSEDAHRMIDDAARKYLSIFFGENGVRALEAASGGNIPSVYIAARPFLKKYILPAIKKQSRAKYKAMRRAARRR